MSTYSTPGVYYERADLGAPRVAPLRTDIAAFVGIAARGPLHQAVPVESWRQFVAYFGDVIATGYLAYAVRAFFENGGRRCWIVRVASAAAAVAIRKISAALPSPPPATPHDAWAFCANSEGVWGNDLAVELRETHRAQTIADPRKSTPEYVTVASVAGFQRGTHARAHTDPSIPSFRVVSAIDPDAKRLYWVNPRPQDRLPYEQAVIGYDPNRPLLIESVEYTLLVHESGRLVGAYQGLSLCPAHPRYGPLVLGGIEPVHEGALEWTVPAAPEPIVIRELRGDAQLAELAPLRFDDRAMPLAGGADGLAPLRVGDFIGETFDPFDDDAARLRKRRGISALDSVSEISLVAVPDIHIQPVEPPRMAPPRVCTPDPCLPPPPPQPATPRQSDTGDLPPRFTEEQVFQVQNALVDDCEGRRDRFALLDPPFTAIHDPRIGLAPLRAWRRRFDSAFAALYGPWIAVPDPLQLGGELMRPVPASGHVAGFIAQTDTRIGVHKAPANGALIWAQALTLPLDDTAHGVLNDEHVNAIRAYPGRGLRIFGARTLSSDPDWRFVNVRRLLIMIEKAIRISSQWAVFEPNNRTTRAKVELSLQSFLLALWQRGALAGGTADQAFFVQCNEDTDPASARDRGELIAKVGVAPSNPFEFIVLRVGRAENGFEITETGGAEGGS